MKFEANSRLYIQIIKYIKGIEKTVFFSTIIFFIYSFSSYYSITKSISIGYLIGEVLLLGALAIMHYTQITRIAKIIHQTAVEISFSNDYVIIKTSSFKILFVFKWPSTEIKFKIDEIMIRKAVYPLKQVYNLAGTVLEITDKQVEAYLIVEWFDTELVEKINEYNIN